MSKLSFIKKLIFTVLISLTMVELTQAAKLKISHVRPQGTAIDKDINQFVQDVGEATDRKINIKIFPASSLGDYTLVQERVSLGVVDMAVQPISSNIDKRFQIFTMPYMVQGWDDAKRKFASGSVLRKTVSELYKPHGIKVLAAWPVYFGGISLNKNIVGAADTDINKRAKLRIPAMKTFQLLADNLGYIGFPLPFSEAFTAVQTGVVDGVMGSGAEGYYASFRDVTKCYVPMNTHFEVWYMLINEERFNRMKPLQQKAIAKAALDFEVRRWNVAEDDQKYNEQRLVDAGATLVEVTPEQISAAAKKAKKNAWPEIIEDIGKVWASKILEATSAE